METAKAVYLSTAHLTKSSRNRLLKALEDRNNVTLPGDRIKDDGFFFITTYPTESGAVLVLYPRVDKSKEEIIEDVMVSTEKELTEDYKRVITFAVDHDFRIVILDCDVEPLPYLKTYPE